ncbi:MAG: lysophospholipid acyltransferase family protein, partial [Planctomycetaceae bacterium]|nr:lysophospholipid acyltransferase family protein [Planctomycetaceae bacterium]
IISGAIWDFFLSLFCYNQTAPFLSSRASSQNCAQTKDCPVVKIRSRFLNILLAWAVVYTLRTIFRTLRMELHCPFDVEVYTSKERPETHISSVWHDQLIYPTFGVKSVKMSALISQHQDGQYLAECMRLLGFGTIRGSSHRGAVLALKEMVNNGSNGGRLVMTPDGPRGPQHELKSGVIYIASKTGMPVICVAAMSKNPWVIKGSWTNLYIPKPFSRTVFVASEMIPIPADIDKQQIEEYRQQIQQRMEEVQEEATAILAGERKVPTYMDPDAHSAEADNRQAA